MKRFNRISKLSRITLNLCLAIFIIIAIPLLSRSISPPSDYESELHYGLSETGTVYVAPPTGETDSDRASILAALENVGPGGIIQFAPGTYLVGKMISVTIPRVTLLGHSEGTINRGCDPDEMEDREFAAINCHGLELAGSNQTVRGFTFEYAYWALHLGC